MSYRLSDETIGQIAKLLQVAIITGTDIVDNLRTIRLQVGDGEMLEPTADYIENFERNLNRMIESLAEQTNDNQSE
jgi:hypothetical protein